MCTSADRKREWRCSGSGIRNKKEEECEEEVVEEEEE
jgi:hypothetical protein